MPVEEKWIIENLIPETSDNWFKKLFFGVDPAHGPDRAAWFIMQQDADGVPRMVASGCGDSPAIWPPSE